jgi:hypothetical protein
MTRVMTREKISATVDRAILAQAKSLTGVSSTSELLDRSLAMMVEAELVAKWHAGYEADPPGSDDDDIGVVNFGSLELGD